VLGGLAEFEHDPLRARTDEGRERVKRAVWSSDANRSFTPEQRREAIKRRDLGRGRGNTRGDCPPLQRRPEHHFEADGLTKRPRSPK
jgi:hypothetical protein